jgi:hypothetical protein
MRMALYRGNGGSRAGVGKAEAVRNGAVTAKFAARGQAERRDVTFSGLVP